ncbi:MAG TPA: STAS domain-containing protein [Actinocrinis sp.]|jgi:anti-anti-sigma factor|uniref:STAS domain-containing protein n=1 Tax=Actinocrinis sp. TaxID=1920516 RepID=UPI002D358897|nr:STAS domain-containing protein [Actinocrinis sp.]HZU58526.1 STAS domain-containing protein [Actinocrinis sp.]
MTPASTLQFAVGRDPDGARVLHVRGEVDLATAGQLRERLLAEFTRHEHLIVDLSRAMLYDGAALRALHALYRESVRTRRQPPTLRGVRPLLAKALKATGMYSLFPRQDHSFSVALAARPGATQPTPLAAAA